MPAYLLLLLSPSANHEWTLEGCVQPQDREREREREQEQRSAARRSASIRSTRSCQPNGTQMHKQLLLFPILATDRRCQGGLAIDGALRCDELDSKTSEWRATLGCFPWLRHPPFRVSEPHMWLALAPARSCLLLPAASPPHVARPAQQRHTCSTLQMGR